MRHLVRLGAVSLVLVAVGVASAGDRVAIKQAENRAAARRDARSLLTKLVLPTGATGLASRPAGDHGYLKPLEALERDMAHAVAHEWFSVPGTPDELISYVRAHPPAGGRVFTTGSIGNAFTGTSAQILYFQWPSVAGVLGSRELAITATALSGSVTGVLAESQSDWIVLRPASEIIAVAQTHEIEITSGVQGKPQAKAFTVHRPRDGQADRLDHQCVAGGTASSRSRAPGPERSAADHDDVPRERRQSGDSPCSATTHFRPWSGRKLAMQDRRPDDPRGAAREPHRRRLPAEDRPNARPIADLTGTSLAVGWRAALWHAAAVCNAVRPVAGPVASALPGNGASIVVRIARSGTDRQNLPHPRSAAAESAIVPAYHAQSH